jgi:hypothetical protein
MLRRGLTEGAHNNGMHPTASQRGCYRELVATHVECAAGDAWRSALIGGYDKIQSVRFLI